MTPTKGDRIEAAQHRAEQALLRATHAADAARRHERQAADGPEMLREFHRRMAHTQRRAETTHRLTARIHGTHARRLRLWAGDSGSPVRQPSLIEAVADEVGTGSVAVALFDADRVEAMVAASDPTARSAQDIEFTVGEGPARDAAGDRSPVTAIGDELAARWPRYGPAVADLGVERVVAAPLGRDAAIGALTVLSGPVAAGTTTPVISWPVVETVAEVVTVTMMAEVDPTSPDGPTGPLLDGTDERQGVHVAAGVVAEQVGCDPFEAVALIRARAFADGVVSSAVADRVLAGDLQLGLP